MTAEAEEVPKTAERTPLISNDHHESFRIYLSSSHVQKIKFVPDSRQPFENGRIFNLAVGLIDLCIDVFIVTIGCVVAEILPFQSETIAKVGVYQ